MKIERISAVAVDVKNLDEAVKLFSDLFGFAFDKIPFNEIKKVKTLTEHADRTYEEQKYEAAISPVGDPALDVGLELIAMPPFQREGLRALGLKVSDLEQAKAEMKEKGIRLLADVVVGGVKEAIYDLHGVRLALSEYEAPTLMDAILQK